MIIYNRYSADSKYQNNILEFNAVNKIIKSYMSKGQWLDPYYHGTKMPNTITNQLVKETDADNHLHPNRFLNDYSSDVFGVLWMPPKGPREISNWLKKAGRKVSMKDTQASFWSKNKKAIANSSAELVITVAYNSGGIGKTKGFQICEIISVHFGKWFNDIIITIERRAGDNEGLKHILSLNRTSTNVLFQRAWAMPNALSHTIKVINDKITSVISGRFTIDPFSGMSKLANITNDLDTTKPSKFHLGFSKFLNIWELGDEIRIIIFDPPFSERQMAEVYGNRGLDHVNGTPFEDFWQDVLDIIGDLEPDMIIFHGWNTNSIPSYEVKDILMVAHGGWHNDTQITIAQRNIPKTYVIPSRLPKEFMRERSDNRALARVVLSDEDEEIRKVSIECLELDQGLLQKLYLEVPLRDKEIKEKLMNKLTN